jgi:hypothetical protein
MLSASVRVRSEVFLANPSSCVRPLGEVEGEAANDPYYTDPALTAPMSCGERDFISAIAMMSERNLLQFRLRFIARSYRILSSRSPIYAAPGVVD